MKVYVVLYESVYGWDCETRLDVFDNLSSASDRFDSLVAQFRETDDLVDNFDFVEEIENNKCGEYLRTYCAYANGKYIEDNLSISLLEKTVYSNSTDMLGIKEPFNS